MISPKITNPHVEMIIATAGLKHFSIKTGKDLNNLNFTQQLKH